MLIRKIEKFLRYTDMPPTRFGRLAVHDPRFVLDLRNGRIPRSETQKKVEHFMNFYASSELARPERASSKQDGQQ